MKKINVRTVTVVAVSIVAISMVVGVLMPSKNEDFPQTLMTTMGIGCAIAAVWVLFAAIASIMQRS